MTASSHLCTDMTAQPGRIRFCPYCTGTAVRPATTSLGPLLRQAINEASHP